MYEAGRHACADGRATFGRRDFCKLAALAAVPFPGFLLRAAETVAQGDGAGDAADRPVLVVVQLSGGNDGLNTVIPFEDGAYYRARPSLSIPRGAALRLQGQDHLAFHPSLEKLRELHDEGDLTVVENVGYPGPDRSHFRSMEIWHTARPDSEEASEGWLGRALQQRDVGALDIGDDTAPLALAAEGLQVPALQNLDWLEVLFTERGSRLRQVVSGFSKRPLRGDLAYLQGLTRTTFSQLDRLQEIRKKPSPVEYPGSPLGQRLQWTGQLIAGGFPSRIYYTSFGGFDTHAFQKDNHATLLRQLSEALGAFAAHLREIGCAEKVVAVVFSEFGRRVAENGSQGTDHGEAGPMFVLGGAARGGVLGGEPDLADLHRGDVRYRIDFRSVYATLLEEVLGLESSTILGGRFEKLPILERLG